MKSKAMHEEAEMLLAYFLLPVWSRGRGNLSMPEVVSICFLHFLEESFRDEGQQYISNPIISFRSYGRSHEDGDDYRRIVNYS